MNHIFRKVLSQRFNNAPLDGFVMIDNPRMALRHATILIRSQGSVGYMKLLAKSCTGNRLFYFLEAGGVIASCGTLTIGFCRFYPIEPGAVVIGTVWTDHRHRSQGLATRAIQGAMDHLLANGISIVYIDTYEGNTPMLKSIAKLGFGSPVDSYDYTGPMASSNTSETIETQPRG